MKILEKKFEFINEWCDWADSSNDGFSLCEDGIRTYFYIPDLCETIWISIHTTPTKEREAFRVLSHTYRDSYDEDKNKTFPYLTPEEEVEYFKGKGNYYDFAITIQDSSLDRVLSKYINKVVYVQVEYEE